MSSRTHSHQSQCKKLVEGKWVEDCKKESKVHVDVVMRDANSGELLGKGTFECNPDNENRDKYEENISIKSITGQEIGTATVEIAKPKPEVHHRRAIDRDMNDMRRALGGMMKHTNRMFRDFSKNFFRDDDFGFGVLDDIMRPNFMLENEWFPELKEEGQRKLSPKKRTEAVEGQPKAERKEVEGKRKTEDGSWALLFSCYFEILCCYV